MNQDFSNELVNYVAQADWSEVLVSTRGVDFRDKGNESIWDPWVKITGLEGCFN